MGVHGQVHGGPYLEPSTQVDLEFEDILGYTGRLFHKEQKKFTHRQASTAMGLVVRTRWGCACPGWSERWSQPLLSAFAAYLRQSLRWGELSAADLFLLFTE